VPHTIFSIAQLLDQRKCAIQKLASEKKKKNIPDSFGLSALDSYTGIIGKTKIWYCMFNREKH
jgi:hypothetical protein